MRRFDSYQTHFSFTQYLSGFLANPHKYWVFSCFLFSVFVPIFRIFTPFFAPMQHEMQHEKIL